MISELKNSITQENPFVIQFEKQSYQMNFLFQLIFKYVQKSSLVNGKHLERWI